MTGGVPNVIQVVQVALEKNPTNGLVVSIVTVSETRKVTLASSLPLMVNVGVGVGVGVSVGVAVAVSVGCGVGSTIVSVRQLVVAGPPGTSLPAI
jgi:hypothetical protein